MIIIDEYNRKIKKGDSYYIVTVWDEYHMPIREFSDRIFKNKGDLNHFTKILKNVAPKCYITSRQAIYSGSGWGI